MNGPRAAFAGALALAAAASAPGYYHFVHFVSGGERTVEKLDLSALPDRRVLFFVSRQQLPALAPNDSFDGVLSQIRQALDVWDAVPTSALRVGFGGVVDGAIPGNAPAGQIIFAELPPGVIGMGGPVSTVDSGSGFLAIQRSQVVLSNNLVDGSRPRTSFSELFFSTLVHEIGHALGLQHTLASSAMSTDVTRSTTRPQPLGADDLAGLSALYPTGSFSRRTGRIEGRVSFFDGSPAALASVAAIHPGGGVVTGLTDPDGRYRIEGLLPGDYLLYAQPLPPASQDGLGPANVVLPVDPSGLSIASAGVFRATFRGGSARANDSPRVAVRAGGVEVSVDFQVEPRRAAAIANVTTYSFPGNNAPGVHPAFLDLAQPGGLLVATGQGLATSVPQLRIEALELDVQIRAAGLYEPDPRFVRIDFNEAPLTRPGPLHLLFRTSDDLYLLPAAVHLTTQPAPVVHWVTPDFTSQDGAWRVGGTGFDPASGVYFDGAPGTVLGLDPQSAEIVVVPPPGPPGRRAVVTVYNPDGQSSALTLPDGNAVFEYAPGGEPSFEITPAEAPIDSDTLIEIRVSGAYLEASQLALGFGSSDVVVREIDAIAPDRLRAVVTVLPGAAPGRYPVTLSNGLQTIVRRDAFQTMSPAGLNGAPQVRYGALVNSATGLPALSPGTLASLFGANLAGTDPGAVRLTIGGIEARLVAVTGNQINVVIPEQSPIGATEVVLTSSSGSSPPMLIRLERASPGIFTLVAPGGGATSSIAPGQAVSLIATGLGSVVSTMAATETLPPLQIVLGGMRLTPSAIEPFAPVPGTWRVRFDVPSVPLPETVTLSLLADGSASNELRLSSGAKTGD